MLFSSFRHPKTYIRLSTIVCFGLMPFLPSSPVEGKSNAQSSAVISFTQIPAQRAAKLLHRLFPNASLVVDGNANAILIDAPQHTIDEMRSVVSGIDVKNPLAHTITVLTLQHIKSDTFIAQARTIFPAAKITTGPNSTVIVWSTPSDTTQIQAFAGALDVAPAAAPTPPPKDIAVVHLDYGSVKKVAKAAAAVVPALSIRVAGSSIVLSGSSDAIARAKEVISALDRPETQVRYSVLYHPRAYAAQTVASLLRKTFTNTVITVETGVNSFSALATPSDQRSIADAVHQLDAQAPAIGTDSTAGETQGIGTGGANIEIYTLRAALPGITGGASTSAADLAGIVTQTLSGLYSDLRITAVPGSQQLILTGSPYTLSAARSLLAKLDVVQDLVILDTRLLEIDENSASDLGLSLPTPVISTNYSETTPVADATTGIVPRIARLRPIQRTPLSLTAQLNFMIQKGRARVLANPRITTVSGRTATIRAGDTISVQTTAGGGAGTVATTQLQTFQTGVSLDITPIINADNIVAVTLHPTVNSETGILNGIPQIATRDTQTTVALHVDQTLIIGGLIQESSSSTENKIPGLSNIPIIGSIFKEKQKNATRNELVIMVTPHIVSMHPKSDVDQGAPIPLPPLPEGTTLEPSAPADSLQSPMPSMSTATAPAPAPSETATAAPSPLPSALSNVNTFTYGTPPQNDYAKPSDPVQIFYVTMNPTVLHANTPASISVVTTTNADRVTLAYNNGSVDLTMKNQGEWIGSFPLSAFNTTLPTSPGNITLSLKATHNGGSLVTVPIPVSYTAGTQ